MDDGSPDTGNVHAYGVMATCFGSSSRPTYIESISSQDCGLAFNLLEGPTGVPGGAAAPVPSPSPPPSAPPPCTKSHTDAQSYSGAAVGSPRLRRDRPRSGWTQGQSLLIIETCDKNKNGSPGMHRVLRGVGWQFGAGVGAVAAGVCGFIQLIVMDQAMDRSYSIGLLLFLAWLTLGAASTGLAMRRIAKALILLSEERVVAKKDEADSNTDRVTAGR